MIGSMRKSRGFKRRYGSGNAESGSNIFSSLRSSSSGSARSKCSSTKKDETQAGACKTDAKKPQERLCTEQTVCSICYIRTLKKPRRVQLECKHFLCDVCYCKVYSCPFCRSPLYGCIGKRLKRASKMFLCLLKEFKQKSCVKASSVLLLKQLLSETISRAEKLDHENECVKKTVSRIYALQGTVYFKLLGDLQRATEEYKKALQLHPNNIEAINLYACVLSRQGSCGNQKPVLMGIELMHKALQLEPENHILLCNLSKYYAQIGKFEESKKLLDKAASIKTLNESLQKYICCNQRFLAAQIRKRQTAKLVPVPHEQFPPSCEEGSMEVDTNADVKSTVLCQK